MEKFLFLDLDDTIFQTLRKCPEARSLRPVAFLSNGDAISYATESQLRLVESLALNWRIIPTTARNRDAFSRVCLPIAFADGAILNHGATIIEPDGAPDPFWRERMREQLAPFVSLFETLEARLSDLARHRDLDLKIRIIQEDDEPYYIVVKHREADSKALQEFCDECVRPRLSGFGVQFYLHLNDNNLAILPAVVNKANAVAFLIERLRDWHGEVMTLGMGDSLTDLDFMALCDYAMIPRKSQLHEAFRSGLR